jgi:hypothetical protein
MRPLPGRTRHAPIWRDREQVEEAAAARSRPVQTAKAFRLQANPTMAKSRFLARDILLTMSLSKTPRVKPSALTSLDTRTDVLRD